MDYEIIEARHYEHMTDGRTASLYGALPSWIDHARTVTRGWTVKNPYTNEVGIGRQPFTSFAEAADWVSRNKPSRRPMYD